MSRNSDLYLLDILDAGQAIQDYVKGYDYETFAACLEPLLGACEQLQRSK